MQTTSVSNSTQDAAIQRRLDRISHVTEALDVIPASEVGSNDQLWPGFLGNSPVLVSGDPAARAHLLCDIAARFSTGAKWVDGQDNGTWEELSEEETQNWPDAPERIFEANGPFIVGLFTSNPEAFVTRFRAYGGNLENLKIIGRAPANLEDLRFLRCDVFIADPLALLAGNVTTEKRVQDFIAALKKLERPILLGVNPSSRRDVSGISAWKELPCWTVQADSTELRLNHAGGTLVAWITAEGLRDGEADDGPALPERNPVDWWLLGRLADREKHHKELILAHAATAGFSQRQVELAFGRLGVKWESTPEVPRRTLWWLE